jgi:biopolymer transport protein TolR
MAGSPVGRGGRNSFSTINITPLVDVILVLLVVFMVTAPLLATGLRVELPVVTADQTSLRDTKLVVTVTKDGHVVFDDRDVTADIEEVLLLDARVQTEREVYVRADKDARYGDVARVVAAARAAGVDGINLLVEPDPEPKDK